VHHECRFCVESSKLLKILLVVPPLQTGSRASAGRSDRRYGVVGEMVAPSLNCSIVQIPKLLNPSGEMMLSFVFDHDWALLVIFRWQIVDYPVHSVNAHKIGVVLT